MTSPALINDLDNLSRRMAILAQHAGSLNPDVDPSREFRTAAPRKHRGTKALCLSHPLLLFVQKTRPIIPVVRDPSSITRDSQSFQSRYPEGHSGPIYCADSEYPRDRGARHAARSRINSRHGRRTPREISTSGDTVRAQPTCSSVGRVERYMACDLYEDCSSDRLEIQRVLSLLCSKCILSALMRFEWGPHRADGFDDGRCGVGPADICGRIARCPDGRFATLSPLHDEQSHQLIDS